MKSLFVLSFLIGFLYMPSTPQNSIIVSGVVTDKDMEPIIGANVVVKGTDRGTNTDIYGKFEIELEEGESTLEISYTGYVSQELEYNGEPLKVILETSDLLDEIVVVGKKHKTKKRTTAAKSIVYAEPMSSSMMVADGISAKTSFADHSAGSVMVSNSVLPKAGQMTAGEWNDLNNWDDWNVLIEEAEYKNMQDYWQIYPVNRYSVFVTNDNGTPMLNALVKLWNASKELLWESITDNAGKAELWEGIKDNKEKNQVDKITVELDKNIFTIKNPKSTEDGTNHLAIPLPCQEGDQVDIAFIVDATGSMGDEIDFLRAELSNIIEEVQNENSEIDYRTASVFYKDHNEDYLTAVSPLDNNVNNTSDFIKTKSAGGGGDYEEAVEAGIEEALSLDWSENAISRLAFLVLDAPPHQTPEVIQQLQAQIIEAAARGIKIIPVTASGINRHTEFLMKFMSIATNGTYVFITDDSGIGEAHLDPVVEDFDVEKLNELIIRLINSYGHIPSCDKANNDSPFEVNMKVFPNPASEFVTVNTDEEIDRIILRSASGMIVLKEDSPKKGDNKLRLDNLVGGMYTVSVEKDANILSTQSLIVLN